MHQSIHTYWCTRVTLGASRWDCGVLGSVLGLDGLATLTSTLHEPANHLTLLHGMWIHAEWMGSLTARLIEALEPKM